jgi:ribonuclease P protein subunit POP4
MKNVAFSFRYEQFLPLHELWNQYINSTFADDIAKGRAPDENRVIKIDCHGALVTVIRSQIPSQIGIRGIVLQETYHCFKLISADNRLITVNKRHSIFSFVLGAHVVRLFGDQIIMRAAERSVKKFKHRNTIEL